MLTLNCLLLNHKWTPLVEVRDSPHRPTSLPIAERCSDCGTVWMEEDFDEVLDAVAGLGRWKHVDSPAQEA